MPKRANLGFVDITSKVTASSLDTLKSIRAVVIESPQPDPKPLEVVQQHYLTHKIGFFEEVVVKREPESQFEYSENLSILSEQLEALN